MDVDPERRPELRPAKGVHLALPVERVPTAGAITFEGEDGRQLFLVPWGEVSLIGTTDAWSENIDTPSVTIEEVHYLLDAANAAFPGAGLNTNDIRSVYAGVRPLASEGDADAERPPSSVSREHRVWEDASGLVTAVGEIAYRGRGPSVGTPAATMRRWSTSMVGFEGCGRPAL